MLHIPILRAGKPYYSLDTVEIRHHRTHEPIAVVSQANAGLIARDLHSSAAAFRRLQQMPMRELIRMTKEAAEHFLKNELPLGDATQSPEDYVKQLSGTTGLPEALCHANIGKIYYVMANIDEILGGLLRGLDITILDRGYGTEDGRTLSYVPNGERFGAVLPSNSPGVHSLWIPAIALKWPLALKPGREEPWSPLRLIQSFIKAGIPEEAFGFYPSGHAAAAELLRCVDRSMVFGGASTTRPYENDPSVEIHGPGYSKVIFGEDTVDDWEKYLDIVVDSIARNGGRSCINASAVWTPRHGREIAEALADRLATIQPLPAEHPDSQLAAFNNPNMAKGISAMIDRGLQEPGAEDLTASRRKGERFVEMDGCAYLMPTIVWVEDLEHTLVNKEFLFPYASVVECPQNEILGRIGPTLVCSAITNDPDFQRSLMDCIHIDRLNIGPLPTGHLSWDQPHEGNLFEHLYRQRAFQQASA
ncbi:MAG: aldehyde dehydrogenase family protein [Planctomycetota bacterium]|nr:aldehyde dehydrogenase family protein [Planctomycetota bacterium]MDA1143163.1 aldehyde dehydrogenase family protein [Planctomycetota bacterium]